MSEYMIFCLGEGRNEKQGIGYQTNNMAWNKPVSHERYESILKEVKEVFLGFEIDARADLIKEWKKVSASQWAKIAQIPEFDLEITKKITGLSVIPIETEKTIDIEGKKFTVSELKDLLAKAK